MAPTSILVQVEEIFWKILIVDLVFRMFGWGAGLTTIIISALLAFFIVKAGLIRRTTR